MPCLFPFIQRTGRVNLILENNIEGNAKYRDATTKNVEGCVRRLCIVEEEMKHGQSGMRIKINNLASDKTLSTYCHGLILFLHKVLAPQKQIAAFIVFGYYRIVLTVHCHKQMVSVARWVRINTYMITGENLWFFCWDVLRFSQSGRAVFHASGPAAVANRSCSPWLGKYCVMFFCRNTTWVESWKGMFSLFDSHGIGHAIQCFIFGEFSCSLRFID